MGCDSCRCTKPLTNPTTVDQQSVNHETDDINDVTVRKDAWSWHRREKANIDTSKSPGFCGDDAMSNLLMNLSNTVLVPLWKAAMEYDLVRTGARLFSLECC